MIELPYIFNATRADFKTRVLEKSKDIPILVDFWANWCAPCRMLMPVLARLVDEYQGMFLLAKVNTDEERQLVLQHGIRSLPTVKLFKDGQVVDEFIGVQPESVVRAMLDRHIVHESEQLLAVAQKAFRAGDAKRAIAVLNEALNKAPDNHPLRLELAEILLTEGELDQGEKLLEKLPREVREESRANALFGRLRLARVAVRAPEVSILEQAIAANPADCEVRYQLGARKVLSGDYEAAMEQMLEILRRDRMFREDAGRKGLMIIFDILGGKDKRVSRYRNLMFNALH
jgi:thioredoxin